MPYIRQTLLGLCIAAAALGIFAQSTEEHKTHHPENAAPPAAAVKNTAAGTMASDKMAAMDQHMKAMQAMHKKMMAAKPQERQALMAEHMKLMQEGMAMMKQMGSQSMNANMAERQQMMEKRMDMMQSMMQMMMDCMPPSAAQ
ncbi:hypothetical protein BEN74_05675 [Acinetobacter sp. WCHAc010034]|uniref:hypothetical protein n=1 Tax=Acinetobacter sp. WCHAc010034 TaxID=1879049 RepID=UPI00083A559F|nr:hypothetical protein [Acinetobacter sp. WCHAc010034]AYA04775.1 hypothetical protein BEN74_05675 [Acinetobacter sp. WCHAc010034]